MYACGSLLYSVKTAFMKFTKFSSVGAVNAMYMWIYSREKITDLMCGSIHRLQLFTCGNEWMHVYLKHHCYMNKKNLNIVIVFSWFLLIPHFDNVLLWYKGLLSSIMYNDRNISNVKWTVGIHVFGEIVTPLQEEIDVLPTNWQSRRFKQYKGISTHLQRCLFTRNA